MNLTLPQALNLAMQLHRGGRWSEAESLYRQVLHRVPDQTDALHYLGLLSHQLGRGQEAVDLMRKAVALAPDYADAHNNLGNVLKERGRLEEAAAAFSRVIALLPRHAAAHSNLGVIYKAQGKTDTAIREYEQALALQPDYVEARLNLGNAFASQDQCEQAIAAYQKVIALKPELAEAHYALGQIYKRQGKLEDAAAAFRKTAALKPGHREIFFDLGNVLNQNGAFDEAIAAYRQAIVRDPGCARAYENLGNALNLTGQTAAAVEVWQQWLKQEPGNPIPRHMMAAGTGRDAPARASDEYVKRTFDWFADTFDERLRQLDYRAPELIAVALAQELGEGTAEWDILDAGCGTGLCGPLLRPYARRLVGVDLSEAMLEKARARNVYDELVAGELTGFFKRALGTYGVIVSADTLVYFGDLSLVLEAACQALRPNGCLIFTLEQADERAAQAGYLLHAMGRYSHTETYVRKSLFEAGFTVWAISPSILRKEAGRPVGGMLAVARALRACLKKG